MSRLSAARLASIIQRCYPRELAGSWDNTGLLLEPPFTRKDPGQQKILLCIDLTTSVCQEALDLEGCAHIITYHPIIFSGLKSLTLSNPQQRSLLRLVAAGISVYSPHTSVDAVRCGMNDMLGDVARGKSLGTIHPVEPCTLTVPGFEDAGVGRIVTIEQPSETIEEFTQRMKGWLNLKHVQLAKSKVPRNKYVGSVAICVGSGGSVLAKSEADVILTGELSHHEILAFIASGTHVILCGHDNSERFYLPFMAEILEQELKEKGEKVKLMISEADSCPLTVV